MDNVADVDECEQLWACTSSEDLQRAAELARCALKASAVAVLSGTSRTETRWASDSGAVDEGPLSDVHDSERTSISTPLRLASGREFGQLRVFASSPRTWDENDHRLLGGVAALLASQIELCRQLTQRIEAEEAYADTRAQLLAVADRIPGLVFERRKLDAGRSAYTFFGSSKKNLPAVRQMMENGIAGLNFVHRDDRETVRAAILRSNLEETDLDLTFRIKDLDQSLRWVRSQSIVRRETDGTVCWDGLCFDISDLVAAREDAEAARGVKDALLLNVSRELRDPLQAIVGLAQMMDAADQRTLDIQAAAQKMVETVDRLLEQAGGGRRADRDSRSRSGFDGRKPERTASGSVEADRTLPQAGFRILLADDLDLNRKLIADMLTFEGHVVDCVVDGAEAVKAARQRSYDLILMDMIMPVMDGVAATRAIRALPAPACNVPIVALTANAAQEQLEACLHAGMDAALTKPMSMDALAAAVATWTKDRKAA